jgi:hypothetical protein
MIHITVCEGQRTESWGYVVQEDVIGEGDKVVACLASHAQYLERRGGRSV